MRRFIARSAVALACVGTLASQVPAQQLPALVAKIYPGSVNGITKAGKVVSCGYGEDHHDAFCFLTKDPIAKVREFYALQGVKFDSIPVGKDQNAKDDGLYDLEEAVRLQLSRETIGTIFVGPVEWWKSRNAADEVSYFHTVIVMSGKRKGRLQGSPQANKAAIMEDATFARFALTPELAAIYSESVELLVNPERLVPLYNKHSALQGSYFRKDGSSTAFDKLLDNARMKRGTEMINSAKPDLLMTQDNKAAAIDALLGELEKEAYPTLILIQRSRSDGVSRDPAILAKEWRGAIRTLKGK